MAFLSMDDILDGVKTFFMSILDYTLWAALYLIEVTLLFFISLMEKLMMIFTGETPVKYKGESMSLINVFFTHSSIRNIYGGIAVIGIAFAFAFAIIAVIRKVLDLRDKQQGMTLGVILRNLLKSILLIFSMTAIMMVSLETTNVLIQQVSAAIVNGGSGEEGADEIYFDESDYAAMARMLNKLGNYSVNPSYRSRYNVNACYNDLRSELQELGRKGVWNYRYRNSTTEEILPEELSWQLVLLPIAQAANYNYEIPLDSYDDAINSAVLNAMDIMKANPHIYPLSKYERDKTAGLDGIIPLDRVLFLAATMGTYNGGTAARNKIYDENPSFYDPLRYPYFTGEKSIYSYRETVLNDFNPSPFTTNYMIVYIGSIGLLTEMLTIILTCGVRIFNLLAMYVASPLVIAAIPLDDGGKFKQWTTAFVVQLLGVVGMVLSLRLFIMFLPVIWSPDFTVSEIPVIGDIITMFVKLIITYTSLEAVGKVNGIFTGILADSAGMQAITAGSMREKAEGSKVGAFTSKALGHDAMKSKPGGGGGGQKKESTGDKLKANKKKREFENNVKRMEEDLAFAEQHGRHNSANGGGKVNAHQLKNMKNTLKHYKEGKGETSVNQAKQLALQDANIDANQSRQQAKDEKANLKDPPMARPIPDNDDDDLPAPQ